MTAHKEYALLCLENLLLGKVSYQLSATASANRTHHKISKLSATKLSLKSTVSNPMMPFLLKQSTLASTKTY